MAASEGAVVLRLSSERLSHLFREDPSLCAKLFCLLSCEQAARLLKLTAEETAPELVLPKGTAAPDHVSALVSNDAYLTIFQKWVRSLATTAASSTPSSTSAAPAKRPAKKAKASAGDGDDPAGALACGSMVDFLVSVKAMRGEADPAELRCAATKLGGTTSLLLLIPRLLPYASPHLLPS